MHPLLAVGAYIACAIITGRIIYHLDPTILHTHDYYGHRKQDSPFVLVVVSFCWPICIVIATLFAIMCALAWTMTGRRMWKDD